MEFVLNFSMNVVPNVRQHIYLKLLMNKVGIICKRLIPYYEKVVTKQRSHRIWEKVFMLHDIEVKNSHYIIMIIFNRKQIRQLQQRRQHFHIQQQLFDNNSEVYSNSYKKEMDIQNSLFFKDRAMVLVFQDRLRIGSSRSSRMNFFSLLTNIRIYHIYPPILLLDDYLCLYL